MNITDVNNQVKASKSRKRLGRGPASGLGKQSGRGNKGLGSRSGANYLRGYIGGQKPLRQRIPMRGFNNIIFSRDYTPVNVDELEKRFESGLIIGIEEIRKAGVIIPRDGKIKLLARGEITKKLSITVDAASKKAIEKISKAGGSVTVTEVRQERISKKDRKAAAAEAYKLRAAKDKKTSKK